MKRSPGTYVNLKGLDDLRKGLKSNLVAKVGILGAKASETHQNAEKVVLSTGRIVHKFVAGSSITNVEIGVVQELGSISKGIPPRSFLRMPLEKHGQDIAEGLAYSQTVKKAVEKGDMKTVFKILGFEGEKVVDEAFTTSGFGQWEKNAPATIAAKGSSMPLIDTSQLRRAISSEVGTYNG